MPSIVSRLRRRFDRRVERAIPTVSFTGSCEGMLAVRGVLIHYQNGLLRGLGVVPDAAMDKATLGIHGHHLPLVQ